MTSVAVLGWLATCLGTSLGLPQLLRILLTRNVEGLSLVSWQTMLGVNIAWAVHGWGIGQLPQLLASALSLFSTIPILMLVGRLGGRRPLPLLLPGLLVAIGMIAVDQVFGSVVYGIVAIAPGLVVSSGQTVELIRARHVRGVSPVSISLAVVNMTMWLTWAWLVHDAGTVIAVAIGWANAVINLAWYAMRRLGLRPFFAAPDPVQLAMADA